MVKVQNSVHAQGIQDRIKQIWEKEKYHLLAVIPNVEYTDHAHIPNRVGEIDILKIYAFGKIGIEEVKSTQKNYQTAKKQLTRASNTFKAFNPDLTIYIINQNKATSYKE